MHALRQSGYATLVVLGTISLLLAVSLGILSILVRQHAIATSLYQESSLAYAARGALEYAKIKHLHNAYGFEESHTLNKKIFVDEDIDVSYAISAKKSGEMTGKISAGSFFALPLYTYAGEDVSGEKAFFPSNIGFDEIRSGGQGYTQLSDFSFTSNSPFTVTISCVYDGRSGGLTITFPQGGTLDRNSDGEEKMFDSSQNKYIVVDHKKLSDFLSDIVHPVLFIYSHNQEMTYTFSSPQEYPLLIPSIVASAERGSFRQSTLWSQDISGPLESSAVSLHHILSTP